MFNAPIHPPRPDPHRPRPPGLRRLRHPRLSPRRRAPGTGRSCAPPARPVAQLSTSCWRPLAAARAGDTVYVAGDAVIECTERVYVEELVLELSGGVTLASDRGIKGAPGGLIRSDTFATRPLIRVTGPDARVTGLRLQGPNPRQCLEHHSRAFREGPRRTPLLL